MLETKYGMKYSFPHSVCHIIDNSMYAGELPVTVTDDPSLYATLVVTGAPMGEDNQIVSINRSDVLNVAYGMSNLTASDIEKYGQSVTYPSSLIAQGVPVKFLRVMPSDATYAFSCLLIQWRWDGSTMHVRYKTSADLGNNGLPPGVVHSRFKNTKAFNESLVKGFHENEAVDEYGVVWKQRVFMNFIAAGRGSEYNHYNYAINEMNQARRPANAKYYFSTIDTNTDMTVENFTASLINQNNASRIDAIDSVNVVVGKRIKGSSLLVPYVNESAIKELYAEYTARMREMYDAKIDPINGNIEWVNEVIKTLNINTFDCLYGLYLYNGDTDVNLPYYQVDMINLNIPKLDESNRLTAYLTEEQSISDLIADPKILNDRLNSISYGINDDYQTADETARQMYHVGDVFLSTGNSVNINMITSINQYTGSVTSIPINQVYTDSPTNTVKDVFRATIDIDGIADESVTDVKNAIKDLISRKKLIPRGTPSGDEIQYQPDFILVVQHGKTSINNLLPTFVIGKVTYNNKPVTTKSTDPTVANVAFYGTKATVYPMLVYPSSKITSFAASKDDEFYRTPGATVVVTKSDMEFGSVHVGNVYVNSYDSTDDPETYPSDNSILLVESPDPFVNGTCPASVAGTKDVLNEAYDLIIYQQSSTTGITWTVTNGSPVNTGSTQLANYKVGDVLTISGINSTFKVTAVENLPGGGQSVSIAINTIVPNTETAVDPGDYATSISRYVAYDTDPYASATPSASDNWAANTYVYKDTNDKYVLDERATAPSDEWKTTHKKASAFDGSQYFIKDGNDYVSGVTGDVWNADKWYALTPSDAVSDLKIRIGADNIQIKVVGDTPTMIQRYVIAGTQGSLYRYTEDPTIIPANYYSPSYGINPNSELGGVSVKTGYSGFFDDNLSDIEFKWKYSELLVKAYRGDKSIDPRIMSPMRCPAKFCFDGATNTIVGQTILPYMKYKPIDIINASTIFTDDEKEQVLLNSEVIRNIKDFADIDVKQAMYDLMVYRCYYGMPEDKRPLGPGYGFQVLFDSGVTDANTMLMINQSFNKRFNNPNASWDIGGFTSTVDGITYTYPKRVVDNMFAYIKPNNNINLPFTGPATLIPPTEYSSFFPDIDATDWELRELLYNSGGNAWVMDINGNLRRESQRTLYRENGTSDLIQESNMRTLSQLCYLLQNKINDYLMAYNEDGVLKTLKDECDNMFSNWVGKSIQSLDISFKRDINPADGGEVVVCYCSVTFRGLILRVPIIVNVQRRTTSES